MAGLLDAANGGMPMPEEGMPGEGMPMPEEGMPGEGMPMPGGTEQDLDYDAQLQDMEARVPGDLKDEWERIMVAGMKFMFDKQGNSMINKALETEGDQAKTVGQGCARLMVMMFKESGSKMSQELIIPAGIAMILLLSKYMKKAGFPAFTAADLGRAVEIYMYTILPAFGVQPEQFDQFIDQQAAQYEGK